MMVTVDDVRVAALEIYKPEGVELWIAAPNRLLEGCSPLELVAAGEGAKVLTLINTLATGS